MSFLHWIESWRTPWLDRIMAAITELGGETFFILIALTVFWCINKKQGYYLLFVGFIGTVLNQFLKLWFRIPRPWVKDPDFTIVEAAREEATGYSFPSGHTQNAVGTFGGLARSSKNNWVRVVSIVILVLVSFSRMYLGVHTPLDVGVSFLIATTLVLVLYPLIQLIDRKPNVMYIALAVMLAIAAAFLLFVECYAFPADIDPHNYDSGLKNAYTLFGALVGMLVVYFVDSRYLSFQTQAPWWIQIIKLVLGFAGLLAIKSGLKALLLPLFNGHHVADAIRYMAIVLFAGIVWPLTFPLFEKLAQKAKK